MMTFLVLPLHHLLKPALKILSKKLELYKKTMKLHLVLVIFLALTRICLSQTVAQSPSSSVCNDIFISYTNTAIKQLTPNLTSSSPTQQPYRFESTLTIINNGLTELKSWMVFVGFQHNEYLVSASNAVLADGLSLPGSVGNGTVIAGYPNTDLKTGVETAGDLTQMGVSVDLIGTEFGVANVSMPKNISLANDGFVCPTPSMLGTREMQVCCTKDPNFKSNITSGQEFLPRQDGDLTIMYDVTKTYDLSYLAQVTISNHNPLGRLDDWKLSWDWMRDEFIFSIQGAYPNVVDTSECIYGSQGQSYKTLDFSTALNCQSRPTIVDLPPTKANDTTLGKIPFCCRNGTILPPQMDPSQSKSVFLMNVFKMPPDNNRSIINPPQNWAISGNLNPDYKCGAPVRVSPSQFPDPSGLPSNTSAVASWQVVCNIIQAKGESPRCCVSFSAYYNDSVVPCQTCACGCQSNTAQTCSATAPAILLPSEALLVPFENRTDLAVAWSNLKHRSVPNPMPCPDNCGMSINWHINTDYTRGWTARITLFNWGDTNFANWFTAVQMDKAGPGYEAVYSFNGSALSGVNNTIFMQGLEGLNYLVAETNGSNPKKDPKVPGKQQSVISFTKKQTPGINIANGEGFPTKVFFNGEECSLPSVFPTSSAHERGPAMVFSFLAILAFMLMQR